MTWILLQNGGEQHLTGPEALKPAYTIETIAHQLALINRFTGATQRPYSVAEHSLLCADLAAEHGFGPVNQLCCLLHDAHESIVGDLASPIKWQLDDTWDNLERMHMRALRAHFGLLPAFAAHRDRVKALDLIALATERRDLLPWQPLRHRPWPMLDTPGHAVEPADVNLASAWRTHKHWTEWRDAFVERYELLTRSIPARQGQWAQGVHA